MQACFAQFTGPFKATQVIKVQRLSARVEQNCEYFGTCPEFSGLSDSKEHRLQLQGEVLDYCGVYKLEVGDADNRFSVLTKFGTGNYISHPVWTTKRRKVKQPTDRSRFISRPLIQPGLGKGSGNV